MDGVFDERFVIVKQVGTGGTASVYQAVDRELGPMVALKVFHTVGFDEAVVAQMWEREYTVLQHVEHLSVVKFLAAGRAATSNERWIALEWIDAPTLETYLIKSGALTWDGFHSLVGAKLLDVLVHLAEKEVNHRDLTPKNILVLPRNEIRVIDFATAKVPGVGIGITLEGWATPPYSPPDTAIRRKFLSRDAFAFCAVAVRAISGRCLSTHDELTDEFRRIDLPASIQAVFARALCLDETDRYEHILEFVSALRKACRNEPDSRVLRVVIRLAPSCESKVFGWADEAEYDGSAAELVASELSGICSIYATDPSNSRRIALETPTYRFLAELDQNAGNHLVIYSAVRRRFALDDLLTSTSWKPTIEFSGELPCNEAESRISRDAVRDFYSALEAHLDFAVRSAPQDRDECIDGWERMLEALRHVARNALPALRYFAPEKVGNRLIVQLRPGSEAQEEELRCIRTPSGLVFRGEVEAFKAGKCTLSSSWPYFDLTAIPQSGELEFDWSQTKKALDRQAFAVDQFKTAKTPSPSLADMLTGQNLGGSDENFVKVTKFFDGKLDPEKKSLVSRCAAAPDLLVVHGPPGTGKTRLIVELIRQEVARDPLAKVLLASQTHVALDNALEKILISSNDLQCVRIGSGSKQLDPRVRQSSLDARAQALREDVKKSARRFIEEKAATLGINASDVDKGIAVHSLIEKLEAEKERAETIQRATAELALLKDQLAPLLTTDRRTRAARLEYLGAEIDRLESDLLMLQADTVVARNRLASLGVDGKRLAGADLPNLQSAAGSLLVENDAKIIGNLVKLSEHWQLRFGRSPDFNAAIVASSNVVAGTCVGFCREEAVQKSTFDLCIVDEAGKATTTELLVPLAQARRAVIVGDHHQLPAVIDNAVSEKAVMERYGLKPEQLKAQLFQKLITTVKAELKGVLTVQYRMRGSIGDLVATCFYPEAELKPDPSVADVPSISLNPACLEKAVTWLDPYPQSGTTYQECPAGKSFENAREARAVVALLEGLAKSLGRSSRQPSIAVLSGYTAQVAKLRTEIRRNQSLKHLNIECASVHAFQGREVDICIYSLTRKNDKGKVGMLRDWRHLNVALSRAKDYLVIVGSRRFARKLDAETKVPNVLRYIESSDACSVREWR